MGASASSCTRCDFNMFLDGNTCVKNAILCTAPKFGF